MTVDGNYAYVSGDAGMHVVSVADSTHPVEVGHYSVPGVRGAQPLPATTHMFRPAIRVCASSRIADPAHPVEVGHCNLPDNAYDVAVAGGYAYVADKRPGLRVVSLADS